MNIKSGRIRKKIVAAAAMGMCMLLLNAGIVSAETADGEGTVTFYWNYDYDQNGTKNDSGDIYLEQNFTYGKNVSKITEPEREEYVLGGWYLEDGTEYDRMAKYSEDISVYAKWTKKYIFEAEKTQLTGLTPDIDDIYDTVTEAGLKKGVALSGSANGEALIHYNDKASGGAFVAGIDYKGAYLDFEFTSDQAEEGAALSMRISARFRTLYMSGSTKSSKVEILVNGEPVTYDDITIERPEDAQDMGGDDCIDYFDTFF
ncbi:MAG: InlB B-repeat-containing protein, partial [Parasporobacterium sp.]|nr:InlB B-repeat-containing protein [Parasporobacterium sp.]